MEKVYSLYVRSKESKNRYLFEFTGERKMKVLCYSTTPKSAIQILRYWLIQRYPDMLANKNIEDKYNKLTRDGVPHMYAVWLSYWKIVSAGQGYHTTFENCPEITMNPTDEYLSQFNLIPFELEEQPDQSGELLAIPL